MTDRTKVIAPLLDALRNDREYLLGWHASLAMAAYDAMGDDLPYIERWEHGQETARRFMETLFAGESDRPEPITNDEVAGGVFAVE